MNVAPNSELIIPVSKDDNGEVEIYAKEIIFDVHPYILVIRYFSEDRENFGNDNCYVGIENINLDANIQLEVVKRVEIGTNGYDVKAIVWSNLVETAEEMREASKLLKDTANAKELFQIALDERFGN